MSLLNLSTVMATTVIKNISDEDYDKWKTTNYEEQKQLEQKFKYGQYNNYSKWSHTNYSATASGQYYYTKESYSQSSPTHNDTRTHTDTGSYHTKEWSYTELNAGGLHYHWVDGSHYPVGNTQHEDYSVPHSDTDVPGQHVDNPPYIDHGRYNAGDNYYKPGYHSDYAPIHNNYTNYNRSTPDTHKDSNGTYLDLNYYKFVDTPGNHVDKSSGGYTETVPGTGYTYYYTEGTGSYYTYDYYSKRAASDVDKSDNDKNFIPSTPKLMGFGDSSQYTENVIRSNNTVLRLFSYDKNDDTSKPNGQVFYDIILKSVDLSSNSVLETKTLVTGLSDTKFNLTKDILTGMKQSNKKNNTGYKIIISAYNKSYHLATGTMPEVRSSEKEYNFIFEDFDDNLKITNGDSFIDFVFGPSKALNKSKQVSSSYSGNDIPINFSLKTGENTDIKRIEGTCQIVGQPSTKQTIIWDGSNEFIANDNKSHTGQVKIKKSTLSSLYKDTVKTVTLEYTLQTTDVNGEVVKRIVQRQTISESDLTKAKFSVDFKCPTIKLTPNTTKMGVANVMVHAQASDENGIDYIETPDGNRVSAGQLDYKIIRNGKYKFIAFDKVGNKTESIIEIKNIDIHPPRIISEIPLRSMYKDRIVIPVKIRDDESGVNIDKIKINDLPNIKFSDLKEISRGGVYIPNTAINGDKEVTVYLSLLTEQPRVNLNIFLEDVAGNSDMINTEYMNVQEYQLDTVEPVFKNYENVLPFVNRRKVENANEEEEVYLSKVPTKTEFNISSLEQSSLFVRVESGGKTIYYDKLRSSNKVDTNIDSKLSLKKGTNSDVKVTLYNSDGTIVKTKLFKIVVDNQMPIAFNASNRTLQMLATNSTLKDKFTPSTNSDQSGIYYESDLQDCFDSFNNKWSVKKSSKKLSEIKSLAKTGIVRIQFVAKDGWLDDITYNLLNSKQDFDLKQRDNAVGFDISLFGTVYTENDKDFDKLLTRKTCKILQKTEANASQFTNANIKKTLIETGDNYTLGSKIIHSGDYAVYLKISILGYKDIEVVKEFNILNEDDLNGMINVENSSRYKYNSSMIYDTVTKKSVAHGLSNCKAISLDDEIYIYSSQGLKVYDSSLATVGKYDSAVTGVDEYNKSIYISTAKGLLKKNGNSFVSVIPNKFDLIKVVDDNFIAVSGKTVYNLASEVGLDTSLVNKKNVVANGKIVGVTSIDDSVVLVTDRGEQIFLTDN